MPLKPDIPFRRNTLLAICLLGLVYAGITAAAVAGQVDYIVKDAVRLAVVILLGYLGYVGGRESFKNLRFTSFFWITTGFIVLFHVFELMDEFPVFSSLPVIGEDLTARKVFKRTLKIIPVGLLLAIGYIAIFEFNRARIQLDRQWRRIEDQEQFNRKILETMQEAVVIIDRDGRLVYANPAFCNTHGYSIDDIRQLHSRHLVHPEHRAQWQRYFLELQDHSSFHDESVHCRKDGSCFHVEVQGVAIESEGRPCLLAVIRDISERKQADEKLSHYQSRLRALSHELSVVEERERHRIATGLHDNVSQELAMVKMALETLQHTTPASEADKTLETLETQCEILTRVLERTHSLIFDLSNPLLYEVGLSAAIESWMSLHIQGQMDIRYDFRSDVSGKELPQETSVLLFQSVRELILNVIKHAQAETLQVAMKRLNKHIEILVKDDGVGFDPALLEVSEKGGYGLFSIRERVEHMGAEMHIASKPNHGTTITLRVPVLDQPKSVPDQVGRALHFRSAD